MMNGDVINNIQDKLFYMDIIEIQWDIMESFFVAECF